MKAITLFSSGGIGDLAIKKHGITILVANELLDQRVKLHRRNFPDAEMVAGNIWEKGEEIVQKTINRLNGEELDFVFATPPCQGMSKNGQGKLLKGIRDGSKPKFDARNQLIIPTLKIIKKLRPKVVFFENVPEMVNTMIEDETKQPINLIQYVERELGKEYVGKPEVVQFADFGIPQRRKRLLTIYSRDKKLIEHFKKYRSYIPAKSHSNLPRNNQRKWLSVRDTIEKLPKLDGKDKKAATSDIVYHRVPVLDPKKYTWISNTPPEKGAFDNQCNNPECLHKGNAVHGSAKDEAGINRANGDTPLFCERCGEILPRPYTVNKDGSKRIMAGYTSAYKRMSWDLPAPTLTTNLCYPSSDHKLHPEQNRVLSLHEAFLLHTLDKFEYEWIFDDGKHAPDTVITEVIGESIPPMGVYIVLDHLLKIKEGNVILPENQQLRLID